ncbi:MAG: tetratricopeptide repeat protein [Gemmatimonadota bacterium]
MRKADLGAAAAAMFVIAGATPAVAQQVDEAEAISFTDTIPQTQLQAMIEQGGRLFNGGTCIICHAVGARGDGRRGPNLTDEEWLHSEGDFEGIMETVRWGVKRSEMKAMTPRPFQMNPNGGMSISFPEVMALSAYVWSRVNGVAPEGVARQDEVLAMLEDGDIGGATDALRADARARPDSLIFTERAVNLLGYEYLQRWNSPETAIELFLFNAETHPESWNTWDSLGEGYAALGETRQAIEMYEKALELNPRSTSAAEALEQLRSR